MSPQPKVANVVARQLMQRIAERGLRPGDHLGAEHELIDLLGVSRGSLREGLRLLESVGVIELRRGGGGGAIISKPGPQVLLTPLAMLLQFQGGSLDTVLEAINAIEPTVAALAAQRRTPTQLALLRACVSELAASVDDQLRFRRSTARFREVLADASGNVLLATLMPSLGWMSSAIAWDIPPSRRRRVVTEHESVLEAIERQDALAATERTRAMLVSVEGMRSANRAAFEAPIVWLYLNQMLETFLDGQSTD